MVLKAPYRKKNALYRWPAKGGCIFVPRSATKAERQSESRTREPFCGCQKERGGRRIFLSWGAGDLGAERVCTCMAEVEAPGDDLPPGGREACQIYMEQLLAGRLEPGEMLTDLMVVAAHTPDLAAGIEEVIRATPDGGALLWRLYLQHLKAALAAPQPLQDPQKNPQAVTSEGAGDPHREVQLHRGS